MTKSIRTIGILGAGKLGVVLSQLAIKAGYEVKVAGSGDPQKIALSMSVLAPGSQTDWAEAVVRQSDIVVLALPLGKYQTVPREALAGKLVIDAMNYWWEVDGIRDDLTDPTTSSSQIVQGYLAESIVVKALNHMGYHDLHDEPKLAGSSNRKAIAVAGDDQSAVTIVSQLIDKLGFDPVSAGQLTEGIKLQPGSNIFGANVDASSLQAMLDDFYLTPRGKEILAARRV